MLEMEPCRSPGEDWCRNQPNKPYLVKKLQKEWENPILGVRKTFAVLGFEEL